MTRTIAMMNQKGGVGKTTTTVNLGAALADAGQRVLLIDLDPQAHLTINYGIDPSPDIVSIYDVLVEERSFLEAVHKVTDHIAVAPSSIDLAGAEVEMASMLGREMQLRRRIEAVKTIDEFDYILMDCPPSLGLLTVNALGVCNEVIIPMQPQFLPLQGVAKLLETVHLVQQRMNPKIKVSGVVLTMFDAQAKLSGEVINELKTFIEHARGTEVPWAGARVFETRIRRNIKLAECPSFGQTIFDYEPTSNGAADYRALAQEVMAMSEPKPAVATKSVEVSINREIDVAQLKAAHAAVNPPAEAGSPVGSPTSSPVKSPEVAA